MTTLKKKNTTGADVLIDTLGSLGIEHIFFNPGIDLVPIMAAMAGARESGRLAPDLILCTDESVAVAAAHGYAMVSGKPQVVALFEDIGTLQGGGAIVNLQYGRIPVIICAGRKANENQLNWRREPMDQRKIIRDYMKWDVAVTAEDDLNAMLRQAFNIAAAEPCGPVYMALSHEILAGENGHRKPERVDHVPVTLPPEEDARQLATAVEWLLEADHPLIMTAYAGRHPDSVPELLSIAEMLAARVITTDLRMNFPSNHPLCPGMDCIKGDGYDPYIEQADVVLLVDYDFPGPLGKRLRPGPKAWIFHIDNELIKNGRRLWDRIPDAAIEGNSKYILPVLKRMIHHGIQTETRTNLRSRYDEITREHMRLQARFRTIALDDSRRRPISPDWLCHCINEVLAEDAILVHQIPSNADAMARQIRRSKPGSVFTWGDRAGSMGWALPAALGAKLAAPGKLVVSIIGDGGFIYGCPVATLWGAAAHGAPFLTIIFNNQAYAIFKEAMAMMYGEEMAGTVAGESGFGLGIRFKNPPDFAAVARGCHAHGETVDDPDALIPALKRAVSQVEFGKSAVLDVKIG